MKKLALSLVVLAGCSHAPVEAPVATATVTTAPQGQETPQMEAEKAQSPEIGLGATTTTEAPIMAPTSPPTTIARPRPVQTTELSVSPTNVDSTAFLRLRSCIAHYESTDGLDPNVYQFTLGTWRAYGGEGDPSDASRAEQDRIFALAWADDGPHHWSAQKGRCF